MVLLFNDLFATNDINARRLGSGGQCLTIYGEYMAFGAVRIEAFDAVGCAGNLQAEAVGNSTGLGIEGVALGAVQFNCGAFELIDEDDALGGLGLEGEGVGASLSEVSCELHGTVGDRTLVDGILHIGGKAVELCGCGIHSGELGGIALALVVHAGGGADDHAGAVALIAAGEQEVEDVTIRIVLADGLNVIGIASDIVVALSAIGIEGDAALVQRTLYSGGDQSDRTRVVIETVRAGGILSIGDVQTAVLEKFQLNDASFVYEPESSLALGSGKRGSHTSRW